MKKKQEELRNKILKANKKYRKGKPIMSDSEFDELLEGYIKKYPNDKKLKKVLGYKISRKEELFEQMMSLDKLKSYEAAVSWLESKGVKLSDAIVISGKLDGISLLVKEYQREAWTRGDGLVGQRSHEHFRAMNHKESTINDLKTYGEAIISHSNWNKHFKGKIDPISKKPYKVPRNTVAGLFNRNEPGDMLQYVDYVRYGIVGSKNGKAMIHSELEELGLDFAPIEMMPFSAFKSFEDPVAELDAIYERLGSKYQIDGLVIDINSVDTREKLGREENGNPAYARAIKLPHWSEQEDSDTVIRKLHLKVSKQGKIKGKVEFDPLIIDGSEVKQASFYNAKFLTQFVLNKGRKIKVKKSGDIIPKIIEVEGVRVPMKEDYTKGKDFEKALEGAQEKVQKIVGIEEFAELSDSLTACPCCGTVTKWDSTLTELLCTNKKCPSIRLMKIVNFFAKMEIEDFGEQEISKLYERGYVRIEDILRMSLEDFVGIEGWGKKSAKKLLKQFAAMSNCTVPLARILDALDLFKGKLGEKTIQLILDNTTIEEEYSIEDLCKIKGVSDITAKLFIKGMGKYNKLSKKFLKKWECCEFYLDIVPAYIDTPAKKAASDNLAGVCACFSGVRDKSLEEKIKDNGGTISTGVSKKTTHLIVKDLSEKVLASAKCMKAKELNIPIIPIDGAWDKLE